MALVLADRVRDTTTTTGTGTVTLSGTAPTGYQNFSSIGNGNTTYYTINGGSEWEVGIGTYSSTGPTLARTTVLSSSNSGSLVNFSAGTKDVFVTYPAGKSVNYDASNNVGIGIAPSTKLDVAGPIWSRSGGSVGAVASLFADASSGANGITLSASFVTGGYGPIKLDAGGSERMRIDSSGNVGIGTTSPIGASGYGWLTINGSSNSAQSFSGGGTEGFRLQYVAGTAMFVNTIANIPMLFQTNNTEQMRITAAGNVGIGTSSPQSRLHIDAPFGAGSFFTGVGNNNSNYPPAVFGLNIGYNFQAGAADVDFFNSWTGATGAQGGFSFRRQTGASSQTSLMRIDGSGNLLVGSTSTPSGNGTNLQVANSGAARLWLTSTGYRNFYLESSSGNALQFVDATAGAERMRISSGGNVGIGTSSPSSLLDVNGNAEVNGTLFLGASNHGNLASDSNTLYARGTNIAFQNAAGSGTYAYINSSGDFGVGTTSGPSTRFNVKGGTTWLQNFNGSASSPTETVDWPVPALNVTSFGDFTLQTMMTFTLPNDGNYFTGDTVWNIRLEQTASSITSSSSTGFRLMGPGYLAFGSGQQERLRFSTSGGITSSDLADAVGYKGLPQNQQTGAYTLALSDMGKHIYATAANFNITIPANSSVAFPIGTAITIVVEDQFHTLVPAGGVTLVLAGTGAATTGTRTLAQGSVATIIKVGTDRWYVSGSGVT